jgi:hypothetical protein
MQAGARPISWISLAGEMQRDWARPTAEAVVQITRG